MSQGMEFIESNPTVETTHPWQSTHQLSLQAEMKSKHCCDVAQADGSCGQRSLVLEEEGQEGQERRHRWDCWLP